jgi:N-formylmaleamate deformylase
MRSRLSLLLVLFASLAEAAPSSFSVKVEGKGPPMILIPGLACGADVWTDVAAHYRDRFQIHALTLAGFAGQKPIGAPLLATAQRELAAYIRENHLVRPVVIGHSLGGFLALALAASDPDLVGPVVAVDGVPFLPALMVPDATPGSMEATASQLRDRTATLSTADFAAQQRRTLSQMITAPASIERTAAAAARSDPRSVGQAAYELMTTDLRPRMGQVRAPVLLLAAGALIPPDRQATVGAAYQAQISRVPDRRFAMATRARHFIMLDDPAFFFENVDPFLAGGTR